MSDGDLRELAASTWVGVGVYPTPAVLVRRLATLMVERAIAKFDPVRLLTIQDVCAGDGRLGRALARRLVRRGYSVRLELIEVDPTRLTPQALQSSTFATLVKLVNFAKYRQVSPPDIIVTNPPYLALNRRQSAELGLDWSVSTSGARNLYGVMLAKCIRDCAEGGLIGYIGPHGWILNARAGDLRRQIVHSISTGVVDVRSTRRLFPGVHQDTSVHVLHKGADVRRQELALKISYDRSIHETLTVRAGGKIQSASQVDVRVGPFVWNRQSELIAARTTRLRAVYGRNIGQQGHLINLPDRYANRQYLARTRVPLDYIMRGPCILIKRTLRGRPGDWRVDLHVVRKSGVEFVAENHVLVVGHGQRLEYPKLVTLAARLKLYLEQAFRHSGHANLSATCVRGALADLSSFMEQQKASHS